jgi:SpoVK/Ycf46/Vps4 family AAA+-type ATPase
MNILVSQLPDYKDDCDQSILVSRVGNAVNAMLAQYYKKDKAAIRLAEIKAPELAALAKGNGASGNGAASGSGAASGNGAQSADGEASKTEASVLIPLQEPKYRFDQIILDEKIAEELQYAIKFEAVRDTVYGAWGLRSIEPSPKLALNFHGDSGTGKTMAAHALAQVMGKKIIPASYAEIESKFHGDGPKNVKNIFRFARENNAVLFIDEADSLLSRRLTNVTQGSEQAINSMRSQLLIEIENYDGVVIFATNLATNYDSAFITRIKSIHFKKPGPAERKRLWEKMLLPTLPLASDIDTEALAAIEDVCGRDIKNAVVKAAVKAAIDGATALTQADFETALQDIIASNKEVSGASPVKLTDNDKQRIARQLKRKLKRGDYKRVRL